MTFWASLSVGISEPPASQVQQHSREQVGVFCKGQLERYRSAPGWGSLEEGLEESQRAGLQKDGAQRTESKVSTLVP